MPGAAPINLYNREVVYGLPGDEWIPVMMLTAFVLNSTRLPAQPLAVPSLLHVEPFDSFLVYGFASSRETSPRALSRRRAEAMRDWLLTQGLTLDQLDVRGMGVPPVGSVLARQQRERSVLVFPARQCGRDIFRWSGNRLHVVRYAGDREVVTPRDQYYGVEDDPLDGGLPLDARDSQ